MNEEQRQNLERKQDNITRRIVEIDIKIGKLQAAKANLLLQFGKNSKLLEDGVLDNQEISITEKDRQRVQLQAKALLEKHSERSSI